MRAYSLLSTIIEWSMRSRYPGKSFPVAPSPADSHSITVMPSKQFVFRD